MPRLSHRNVRAAAAAAVLPVAAFERLEGRRMLHGDNGGLDPDLVERVRSMVRNGEDTAQFLNTDYDPHKIGVPTDDGRLRDPVEGGDPQGGALPDMIPWTGTNNNYFHNTQIDSTSIPGRALLRFSTAIANAGQGPVELLGGSINDNGTQTVYQRIYDYNAGSNSFSVREDRVAGEFIYHPGHNHLHFEGYAEYKLLQDNDGTPGELAKRDDGSDVLGEKVGFCLINITTYNSSLPGYNSSPSGYGCGTRQGISVGRADVYSSGLDSQWIDVTGVTPGTYWLEVTLDAQNAIMESNEDNNTIQVKINISNTGSTANGTQKDRFDVIQDNGSFDTATDLGSLGDRVESSLTLHYSDDLDYYKFTAASDGQFTALLTYSGGDPNLYMYDENRNEIDRSTLTFGTERVEYDVEAGKTYYVMAKNFQYLDDIVDNYSIQFDGPLPAVSVEASAPSVPEGRSMSLFVSRTGQVTNPLTADLTFGGTATFGVDYEVSTTQASFGADADTIEIVVTALRDSVREGTETIEIGVASGSGYVGMASPITVDITELRKLNPDAPFNPNNPGGPYTPGGGVKPLGGTEAGLFRLGNLGGLFSASKIDGLDENDGAFAL